MVNIVNFYIAFVDTWLNICHTSISSEDYHSLILASQSVLFNTSYRTRRKIVQCFDQECEGYQKGGVKP